MERFMRPLLISLALLALACVLAAEEPKAPKLDKRSGVLGSIGSGELTLIQRGDGGERKTTFLYGPKVKVQRETDDNMTVAGEGGRTREVPKIDDAAATELAAGQRVTITATVEKELVSVL